MNTNETNQEFWLTTLILVQGIFILMGVVIFLITPKTGKREYLHLGFLLILTFFIELIGFIGNSVFHENMNWTVNIFILLNLPLIMLMYKNHIPLQGINRFTYLTIVLFLSFALINISLIHGFYKFDAYSVAIACVCVVIVSIFYFYLLLQQLPTATITKLPMFWINTAMLVYHSGTFIFFLSAEYLITVLNNNLTSYLFITYSVGIIYYAMLSYGLWLVRSDLKIKELTPPTT